jgi:hypothetical protein
LYGREQERARLTRLVAAAHEGASGAIVVRGEAGVGKTSLLDDTSVADHGVRVLRATVVESERELLPGPAARLVQLTDDREVP